MIAPEIYRQVAIATFLVEDNPSEEFLREFIPRLAAGLGMALHDGPWSGYIRAVEPGDPEGAAALGHWAGDEVMARIHGADHLMARCTLKTSGTEWYAWLRADGTVLIEGIVFSCKRFRRRQVRAACRGYFGRTLTRVRVRNKYRTRSWRPLAAAAAAAAAAATVAALTLPGGTAPTCSVAAHRGTVACEAAP